jgi:transcriptional regulator with XRE-family HTH domain
MPKEIIMYKRIRDLREDADMTQVQIAKILNCSQRVYSNYERGDIDIPTEILIKLANFHDVSVDYILGRTNNRETNR